MGTLWLPRILPLKQQVEKVEIKDVSSVIIIGANGSGKSRLGAWIDAPDSKIPVHRISAQRALTMQEHNTPAKSAEMAERMGLLRNNLYNFDFGRMR